MGAESTDHDQLGPEQVADRVLRLRLSRIAGAPQSCRAIIPLFGKRRDSPPSNKGSYGNDQATRDGLSGPARARGLVPMTRDPAFARSPRSRLVTFPGTVSGCESDLVV